MALILSLETSSEICSVCLHDNYTILAMKESSEAFSHTRKITVFIEECFQKANRSMRELKAIAVSHGPGSYTGLRVSAATAKGICYGLNIPLIAIDTLTAIAKKASIGEKEDCLYIPMIDARRMEVYHCVMNHELATLKLTNNLVLEEGIYSEWEEHKKPIVLCGTGVEKSKHLFQEEIYRLKPSVLSASNLVPLATSKYLGKEFEELVSYEPNYFKAPKVTQSKKKPF